ncbi:DUF6271 family protein [Metabacillus halosaccharovorans]|uniref:DUF6271 family protein n=1 Tax=Metabacillus halosaccharovorans TaxID=930124 RepID=UPI001C1FDE81|nr:DUF6271 family protein [Metabacillus halosaccharovorans]MBU7595706.1 hypothetical protein [Metabacillus halosaccharovorans]
MENIIYEVIKISRLYAIPTNRLTNECINSLSEEVNFVQNKIGQNIKMAVIDSSDSSIFNKNREAIIQAKEEFSLQEVYHIKKSIIDKICFDFVQKTNLDNKTHLISLLNSDELSYGMAANRTFLLAAVLNCQYLHRRDSDVFINNRKENKSVPLPIEIEINYLGNKCQDRNIKSHEGTIYMVGSGYLGDWAIDLMDMAKQNFESFCDYILVGKSGNTKEEVEKIVNDRFIQGYSEEYVKDEIYIPGRQNYIEVGNYSLYKIFLSLPLSPAIGTIGTDYFYHALMGNLGMPMVYHNRRLVHKHSKDRKDIKQLYDYHFRLVKHRCLVLYYSKLYKNVREKGVKIKGKNTLDTELIRDELIDISRHILYKEQENIIQKICEVYRNSNMKKYINISEFIETKKMDIINSTHQDVYNHAMLINIWPQLIEFARERGLEYITEGDYY